MTQRHDEQVARVRPSGLKKGAVIAQSLDNQWVNAELTRDMIARGRSLSEVDDVRGKEVRAEYFRGLINTRQVVANRTYFYNNAAISRDYLYDDAARRAHQKLLADGSLVPFLLHEREPTDRPTNVDLDETAFTAWQETLATLPATARMTCLRMSWNDEQNRLDTQNALFRPFAARVQALTAKDLPLLAQQVGVEEERLPAFARRIGQVVDHSNELSVEGRPVTRNVLYERFVSVPGRPVSEGRYDRDKPFAGEIKQLIDLIYNVNLADALSMYPLTPGGSLQRVALQEWRDLRGSSSPSAAGRVIEDPDELSELLRFLQRQAFSTVQGGLTPAELDVLELGDIATLRETGAWNAYITAFDHLLADPATFGDRVGLVFDRYIALNRKIVELAAARRGGHSAFWSPVVEVVVNVGGSVVTAVTGDETWSLTGALGATALDTYGGSVRLVLRNRIAGRREQKFAREIATVRLETLAAWQRFQNLVERLPGYREVAPNPGASNSTTMRDDLEY
ncbi:hypothetical protein [Streptomyces buecherae]|uniref:Uncharacterized protein n=1 Tax=Streptomyces buecherae TaxID=2763006 RepID=A0A7H8N993_9ACTN|nr:hypothetical protein [Streptomyces buecherae]QKW51034.1 hypothetical protein HUT08_17510 [Streptomyces buecherae]